MAHHLFPKIIAGVALVLTSTIGSAAISCTKVGATTCIDSANPRIINGVSVSRACWEYAETYTCVDPIDPVIDYCAPIASTAGCSLANTTCETTGFNGSCLTSNSSYACSQALTTLPPNVIETAATLAVTSDTVDRSACANYLNQGCTLVSTVCNDPPGSETRTIDGLAVTKSCWDTTETYQCVTNAPTDYCQATKTTSGCTEINTPVCTKVAADSSCLEYTHTYRCGEQTSTAPVGATLINTEYTLTGMTTDDSACNVFSTNVNCALKTADICLEGPETRTINGIAVSADCWRWERVYACPSAEYSSNCSVMDARAECTYQSETCKDFLTDGITCSVVDRSYLCSTGEPHEETITKCDNQSYCVGTVCFDTAHPADGDFARALVNMELQRQVGFSFFDGKSNSCETKLSGTGSWGNCCFSQSGGSGFSNQNGFTGDMISQTVDSFGSVATDYVTSVGSAYMYEAFNFGSPTAFEMNGADIFSGGGGTVSFYGFTMEFATSTVLVDGVATTSTQMVGFGFDPWSLVIMVVVKLLTDYLACTDEEQQLGMARGVGLCHQVGTWCSSEYAWGGCSVKQERFCCFNSKLGRIIQEQGRPQLGKSWGTTEEPDCSGFTKEQLLSLDWSQIDLSEFINDIVANTNGKNADNAIQRLAPPSTCEWIELSTSESACPEGQIGTVKQQQLYETCTQERKWVELSNTCGCDPNWTATGVVKSTACAEGWVGEILEEEQVSACDASKRMVQKSNTCQCAAVWVDTSSTRAAGCGTGFTGQRIQKEQKNSCNNQTQWIDSENTCVCVDQPIDTGLTRTQTCPTGFTGVIREKEVKNYCDTTGATAWVETNRDCACIDDLVPNGVSSTTTCPVGFTGTATVREYQNFCTNVRENVTDQSSCICINNWLDTGPQTIDACGLGFNGTKTMKEQKNFCTDELRMVEIENSCQCIDADLQTGSTREIACPAGFTGTMAQEEQINTCKNTQDWYTTSLNCQCVDSFVDTGYTQGPAACGLGFTGTTKTKEQKNFCSGQTQWIESENTCQCINGWTDTGTVTDPYSCGTGYTGTKIDKEQKNFCSGATQFVPSSDTCQCINGYVDTGTVGPVLDCGFGFTGEKQDKQQQNYCNASDTRWVSISNTCSCVDSYLPTGTVQSVACGSGYFGAITKEERRNTCANDSQWIETSNTCCANVPLDTGETRPGPSCGLGFSGAIKEKEQQNICSGTTAWVQSENTCQCINDWTDTGNSTVTTCPTGFIGSISKKEQRNFCSGLTQWVETQNNCQCTEGSLGFSYGVPSWENCNTTYYTYGQALRTPKTDLCTNLIGYDLNQSQCRCFICEPQPLPPACFAPPVTNPVGLSLSPGGPNGMVTLTFSYGPRGGSWGVDTNNYFTVDKSRISQVVVRNAYVDTGMTLKLNAGPTRRASWGTVNANPLSPPPARAYGTDRLMYKKSIGSGITYYWGHWVNYTFLPDYNGNAYQNLGWDITADLVDGQNWMFIGVTNTDIQGSGASVVYIDIYYKDCYSPCKPTEYGSCGQYAGPGPRMPFGCDATNCKGASVNGFLVQ